MQRDAGLEPQLGVDDGADTLASSDVSTLTQKQEAQNAFQCGSPLAVDTSTSLSLSILDFEELITCPITQERFVNPVVAADGMTYENDAIAAWIALVPADEQVRSPCTGQVLTHRILVPNQFARWMLAEAP